jgi:hypothetical protein
LGLQQIGLFHMLISDRLIGGVACHLIYFAFDDTVALINDAGTDFAAPGRVAQGSPNTLSNSRCSLNVAGMARTAGVNEVSVTYPLSFAPPTFIAQKGVYLNTFDLSGNLSHWVQAGTLWVQRAGKPGSVPTPPGCNCA